MSENDPFLPAADPGTTRRAVLRAAGLAALSGGGVSVLAACASDAEVGAPTASSAAPTSSAPSASPSASASASASTSASSSAPAAPSGPSIATADVPVGGGVVLEDAKYVVTQPTKGEFKAFSSTCTHQGCKVADVSDTINCKCHGSKFSIEDGSVVSPPANKPLAESPTTVSGDSVFIEA
jgi:Rieske Fe-S protein